MTVPFTYYVNYVLYILVAFDISLLVCIIIVFCCRCVIVGQGSNEGELVLGLFQFLFLAEIYLP